MPGFRSSVIALRIWGDKLVPAEVTALLGAIPTSAERKGESIAGTKTGKVRIAKTGGWSPSIPERHPEALNEQLRDALSRVSDDIEVWNSLRRRFRIDLFCGLFMATSNDGIVLAPDVLLELGRRGIELDLDVYDSVD